MNKIISLLLLTACSSVLFAEEISQKEKSLLELSLLTTAGYFIYNHASSETRGINAYTTALESYRDSDFEKAYYEFSKVPSPSSLKESD